MSSGEGQSLEKRLECVSLGRKDLDRRGAACLGKVISHERYVKAKKTVSKALSVEGQKVREGVASGKGERTE